MMLSPSSVILVENFCTSLHKHKPSQVSTTFHFNREQHHEPSPNSSRGCSGIGHHDALIVGETRTQGTTEIATPQSPESASLHLLSYWAFQPACCVNILMFELNLQEEAQLRMHEFNQLYRHSSIA
jgi:hypothetical protein